MSDASGTDPTASEGTAQPPAGAQPPATKTDPPADTTDWKAEAQKWERRAKADADKARANAAAAAELTKLQADQMSEHEKAVAAAKAEGMTEAKRTLAAKLVAAEVRAAAAGRLDEKVLAALTGSLDATLFVGEDGEVDVQAITELVNGIAPEKKEEKEGPPPDPRFPHIGAQGAKGDLALNGPPNAFVQALEQAVGRTP